MGVFSSLRGFLNRHRNKFIISGVVITSSVLLTKYAQQKLKEWQETEAKEFLDRTRKQQHFESTERTCNQTILSLLNTLNESLNRVLDVEDILTQLRSQVENKLELWEKMKILVFTRAACLIYVTVMLVISLKVQLNILGGYLFKDPMAIPTEMQQRYLTLCNNLLDKGVDRIALLIEKEYLKIIGDIELKRPIMLKDLENVFWAIQSAVITNEQNPIDEFSKNVVADFSQQEPIFNDMVNETADLLDSDEVKSVAIHCVNRGFALFNDQLADYYGTNEKITEVPANTINADFQHPSEIGIPMAKLIPIISGLVSKKLPDTLTQQLLSNEKVKLLSANIYESFSS